MCSLLALAHRLSQRRREKGTGLADTIGGDANPRNSYILPLRELGTSDPSVVSFSARDRIVNATFSLFFQDPVIARRPILEAALRLQQFLRDAEEEEASVTEREAINNTCKWAGQVRCRYGGRG